MKACPCVTCLLEAWMADKGHLKRGIEGFPPHMTRMVVCETCGNKRCPHATFHEHACTGSNESGQLGSRYA